MFANIRHQNALLGQLTARVSIAPPTEHQLRVSRWQYIACKLSLFSLSLGIVIVYFAGLLAEIRVAYFYGSELSRSTDALNLVIYCVTVAWLIMLMRLAETVYERTVLKSFDAFSMSWVQPLSGSDCTQALSLIQELRADGAPEYHAAVLAQHRPFYGFDLEVLRKVQYVKQKEHTRINNVDA